MTVSVEEMRVLRRLRERRIALGLSQADVGNHMGIGPAGVCLIESGSRSPHLSTLVRYAAAVGSELSVFSKHDGLRAV